MRSEPVANRMTRQIVQRRDFFTVSFQVRIVGIANQQAWPFQVPPYSRADSLPEQ